MITLNKTQLIVTGCVAGAALLGVGTGMYFLGRNNGLKTNVDKHADRVAKKVTSKFEAAIKNAIK